MRRFFAPLTLPPRDLARLARQRADLGFDVPDVVTGDPRFAVAWTEGADPARDQLQKPPPSKI